MIKLVAFDWNGTLLDDTRAQWICFNKVLTHFKRPAISFARFQQTYDVPFSRLWAANGGKVAEMPEQNRVYFKFHNKLALRVPLKPHVKRVLKTLDAMGVSYVVFSNHPQKLIITDIKRLGLQSQLKSVLGRPDGDDSHMNKRSKELRLLKYLRSRRIKRSEVLCIGDTIEEIEIAREAGFKCVAVSGGNCDTARLRNLNPDFLAANLLPIPKIIAKLNATSKN